MKIGAPGAWQDTELNQNSKPAYSLPRRTFLISNLIIYIERKYILLIKIWL